ncbi:MAG: ATP-binding cassette domain-containing protein, partial [Plesiomonas shigelloides]
QPQALLAALGLEPETLQQRMADISGGQRQRIGLAGCLQLNRPFLFADEPTSALDADSKQRVFALLEQLDCTLLSVSHDPDMVAFCNQHWHIENQQLQVLAHG